MSTNRLTFYLDRFSRSIWFPPIAQGVAALGVLAAARLLAPLVPASLERLVGDDATSGILTILASSLLAVAIFAIGSLVSALNATANSATPRARRLIIGDRVAQNTIAHFIGTFSFAILALVGISTGYYEDGARVILLFCTLLVIGSVLFSLIAWIDQIVRLGGVEQAIDMIARATESAFAADATEPLMGGRRLDTLPEGCHPIHLRRTGFVQLVDGEALGGLTEKHGGDLYVHLRPGDHIDPGRPAAHCRTAPDDDAVAAIRAAFVVDDRRSFTADPRYGLIALSEIASRALSPGINDPGTAIDVISAELRVLVGWRRACREAEAETEIRFPKLHVAAIAPGDFLATAYRWIGRDGAGMLEVQAQLHTALGALARQDPEAFAGPARRLSDEALERAAEALTTNEIEELRRIAVAAFDQSGRPAA